MNESLKKDIKDLSREELERIFIEEVEQCDKFYDKFIKAQTRLDNIRKHIIDNYKDVPCYETYYKEIIDIIDLKGE